MTSRTASVENRPSSTIACRVSVEHRPKEDRRCPQPPLGANDNETIPAPAPWRRRRSLPGYFGLKSRAILLSVFSDWG